MNFAIDLNNFGLENLSFLDSKKNIIMEGHFTKLNFLTEWFTMNGLYFNFPIEIKNISLGEKNIVKFDAYTKQNISIIQYFSTIEQKLLYFYSVIKGKSLQKNNLLTKQLYSGHMKVILEKVSLYSGSKKLILKISGIWETDNEIGITYKLFEGESINV
tara:strand:- start:926 stop:1402 length:477 start_codon:yes stop_codon:yes gene_type:complete